MNAISRMSPPHAGHSSGNSSPTRASSFAQAIRDVSCERVLKCGLLTHDVGKRLNDLRNDGLAMHTGREVINSGGLRENEWRYL
jgi:hypothetical protein